MKKTIVLLTIFILYSQWIIAHATPLVFYKGKPIHYKMIGEKEVSPVVQTALKLFEEDVHTVLNAKLKKGSPLSSQLIISILSPYSKDSLASMPQSFRIEEKEGKLYVIGADAQGAAYGIMELSRMLGVSPWIWWADNVPSKVLLFPTGEYSLMMKTMAYALGVGEHSIHLSPKDALVLKRMKRFLN